MAVATATTEKYALVARARDWNGLGLLTLEEFDSYDVALAAWAAATEKLGEFERAAEYAVRSTADPGVRAAVGVKTSELYDSREVRFAVREYVATELGATAMAMVRSAAKGTDFERVVTLTRESMAKRGMSVSRLTVSDAVKARVLLGRCRGTSWRRGCNRGWWVAKKSGPLSKLSCECGTALDRSTLAYRRGFRRLDGEEA